MMPLPSVVLILSNTTFQLAANSGIRNELPAGASSNVSSPSSSILSKGGWSSLPPPLIFFPLLSNDPVTASVKFTLSKASTGVPSNLGSLRISTASFR